MRGQLNRRDQLLLEQRTSFLKEIIILKEQLFAKSRLGDAYSSDNIDLTGEMKEIKKLPDFIKDGMESNGEGEMNKKKMQELFDKMSQKFAEERKKMENQIRV